MKIHQLEYYFTTQDGHKKKPGCIFKKNEPIQLHLASSSVMNIYLQVKNINEEVLLELKTFVTTTHCYSDNIIEKGLDLPISLTLPLNAPTGAYYVLIVNQNRHIIAVMPFFITDLDAPARILFIYPSNTINAYSYLGNVNCYTKDSNGNQLMPVASFCRTQNAKPLHSEFILGLRWLTSLKIPVRWVSDREAEHIKNYEGIDLIVLGGHSEYWTRAARQAFDYAVASGTRALVLSGNTMWWQVRIQERLHHQWMEIYRFKETDPKAKNDPQHATILWGDLGYSSIDSIGSDFNHGGYPIGRNLGHELKKRFKVSDYRGDVLFLSENSSRLGALFKDRYLPLGNAVEFDGMPIKGFTADGRLVPDQNILQAYQANILGFMPGARLGNYTLGTAHYFKKTDQHGGVFQVGSISAFNFPFKLRDYTDFITVATLALLENDCHIFEPLPNHSHVVMNAYHTPNLEPYPQLAQHLREGISAQASLSNQDLS